MELRTLSSHPPTLLSPLHRGGSRLRACVRRPFVFVRPAYRHARSPVPKLNPSTHTPAKEDPPASQPASQPSQPAEPAEPASHPPTPDVKIFRWASERGTGIARESYGRLRDSNNSLIRGRVYSSSRSFPPCPLLHLGSLCARVLFLALCSADLSLSRCCRFCPPLRRHCGPSICGGH